jgi:hypothetical protein
MACGAFWVACGQGVPAVTDHGLKLLRIGTHRTDVDLVAGGAGYQQVAAVGA